MGFEKRRKTVPTRSVAALGKNRHTTAFRWGPREERILSIEERTTEITMRGYL